MLDNLLVHGRLTPEADGCLLAISPESAGWHYVGFRVHALTTGQSYQCEAGGNELCLVLLAGRADIGTARIRWRDVGRRMSVFEGIPPYAIYVPPGDRIEVNALTDLEFAVCSAPGGTGAHPARLIEPQQINVERRGSGNTLRTIHNILPESEPADSLLVVEVLTPGGHWSSYPPHKHDRNALPEESLLEETYYYRVNPSQGYALQRVYTDDGSLDVALAPRNGDVVLVPRGYHPVSAPPGYDVYYLNVMAGPIRTWRIRNDPQHDWLLR